MDTKAQQQNKQGYTMREAINAGVYYHVSVPHWASGGSDVIADSPEEAALFVGCQHAALGFRRPVELVTKVSKHLKSSSIGCAVLEPLGQFQTLTADHYYV